MTATTWTGLRTLLVASPEMNDSVSYWRAWGPLCALREGVDRLTLSRFDFASKTKLADAWPMIEEAAAVFMNRPWQITHTQFLDFAKLCGRPTWVDVDDCIWELPWSNPAKEFYGVAQLGFARDALCRATVVTCSTPELASYVQDRLAPDADIHLVPNALPDWYTWSEVERKKLVVYRGGRTHNEDLASVADDIVAVAKAHPDWHFAFCGVEQNWGRVTRHLDPKQYTTYGMRPVPEFHAWLRGCGASIMIVPLQENLFNRCKSNISLMEGSFAGAAVLAPSFPEFRVPGPALYRPGEFRGKLADLINASDEDRAVMVAEAREWIDKSRRLSLINGVRYGLLEKLIPD